VALEVARSGFRGSFALAGRSRARLEAVAEEAAAAAPGTAAPGLLLADASDAPSLAAMAAAARVVVNTVGPFRFYGEAVVAACVGAGASYLDVSGEPEFIERMELKYRRAAAAAGCYVASAVGFDSVPAERCTLVETFITVRAGPRGFRGHYPTYESAVAGVAAAEELAALRRAAAADPGGRGRAGLGVPGPRPARAAGPRWEPRVGAYAVPFAGSDASVVRRTAAAMAAAGRPATARSTSP
jgi:hypothetical protein